MAILPLVTVTSESAKPVTDSLKVNVTGNGANVVVPDSELVIDTVGAITSPKAPEATKLNVVLGDPSLLLEDASYTAEDAEYLGTERVQTLANYQILAENGDRLTLEDGGSIVDERTQGHVLSSYVPFGNKIGRVLMLL